MHQCNTLHIHKASTSLPHSWLHFRNCQISNRQERALSIRFSIMSLLSLSACLLRDKEKLRDNCIPPTLAHTGPLRAICTAKLKQFFKVQCNPINISQKKQTFLLGNVRDLNPVLSLYQNYLLILNHIRFGVHSYLKLTSTTSLPLTALSTHTATAKTMTYPIFSHEKR